MSSVLKKNYTNISGIFVQKLIKEHSLNFRVAANCKADIMIMVEPTQKKGKEYMQVKEVKTKLYFGTARAHFDNLFNGNSVLGKCRGGEAADADDPRSHYFTLRDDHEQLSQ